MTGGVQPYPQLLTAEEKKRIQAKAESLWADLEANQLGGYSDCNRPFWIAHIFQQVIEEFSSRDTGLHWSRDQLDAHPEKPK